MPRFRSTVLRMMVALAIGGIALAPWMARMRRLSDENRALAESFRVRPMPVAPEVEYANDGDPFDPLTKAEVEAADKDRMEKFASWKARMVRKYERAARYPWLPVAPEPE